ncbi:MULTISPECIES: cytochrome b/b6 domain-containing protein [Modicisalibacter]|uniref:Cytochrome b/b6 domain-containing protein n=1 Tax=Modicisalibacter tunisiensis TaxID=390637 RepID=A0ABS7WVX0_9GAMM|nr:MULTISPECIES: cytochrome b/b6 domain-containing protein [Modicisalibacter]KXS38880.1 MAG: cytochrome b [Halomonadaceae bacterium T82-2]MBZ9540268.1 cytochrome b/b6 domain-containing protein [Modicisalibacter tunisiensis]MBZ9566324.1 cytochrome b/b6 domain-containing protein [Modicisalibacter tunisiensis]
MTHETATIKVWDLWTRLFHWSLVTAFATAWLTSGVWQTVHEWAGYSVAALIAWRLLWGLVGPHHVRFRHFIASPGAALGHLKAMARRREPRYLGHNPAGGLMIAVLLAGLAAQALTGWLQTTDAFWGVAWVQETHQFLGNALLALVGLHVAGVIASSWQHRENLARSMVTGHKRAPGPDDIA